MIIKYSRKLQQKNLIPGITFLVLGLISVWLEPFNPVRYFPMIGGILFLAHYFFLQKNPYLEIEDGVLTTRNSFRRKEIVFSEITRIRKFAGDITLFTSEKQIRIHKDAVDKDCMEDLEQLLASLDAEVQEHPCKKISFNHS